MIEIEINTDDLVLSSEMSRSHRSKQFEERLTASIREIGLTEPIKVAKLPTGRYLVVDGAMRVAAIRSLTSSDEGSRPLSVRAYEVEYERRFEVRYQTDIYQDLLPSQLALLVEHLHEAERISKHDIARYIGVSPTTLRNYTGLSRLLSRGGLFTQVVDLMDGEVFPASNPYAWLRLTATGLRRVIEVNFSNGEEPDRWADRVLTDTPRQRFSIKYVEAATSDLSPKYYRQDAELRNVKRDLGRRRATASKSTTSDGDSVERTSMATSHLAKVARSSDRLLQTAARSFQAYLS